MCTTWGHGVTVALPVMYTTCVQHGVMVELWLYLSCTHHVYNMGSWCSYGSTCHVHNMCTTWDHGLAVALPVMYTALALLAMLIIDLSYA